MKFKLDENLPHRAVAQLRERGHDAVSVLDQVSAGTPDAQVAELVRDEGRALVTLDLDFSDIRAYAPEEYSGIVVLRPRRSDAEAVLALVERLLAALETEPLVGRLWIVEAERIRVRGVPR